MFVFYGSHLLSSDSPPWATWVPEIAQRCKQSKTHQKIVKVLNVAAFRVDVVEGPLLLAVLSVAMVTCVLLGGELPQLTMGGSAYASAAHTSWQP